MKSLRRCIADELEWRRDETFDEQAGAILWLIEERGYVIVPEEPAPEMIEALYGRYLSYDAHETRRDAFKAMLREATKVELKQWDAAATLVLK